MSNDTVFVVPQAVPVAPDAPYHEFHQKLSEMQGQVQRSKWADSDFKGNLPAQEIIHDTPQRCIIYIQVALERAWYTFSLPRDILTPELSQGATPLLLLVKELLRLPLPYNVQDFASLVRQVLNFSELPESHYLPYDALVTQLQALVGREGRDALNALRPTLCRLLQCLGAGSEPQGLLYVTNMHMRRLRELLGGIRFGLLERGEAWSDAAIDFLEKLSDSERAPWLALFACTLEAKAGKPNEKWSKRAEAVLEDVTKAEFVARMAQWLPLIMQDDDWVFADREDAHETLMKGLILMTAFCEAAPLVRPLRLALHGSLKKRGRNGVRSQRLCNACLWALEEIASPEAVSALMSARQKTKHGAILKTIENAVAQIAQRSGVSPEDLEELSVPDYGLENGVLKRAFGEARVEVDIASGVTLWTWHNESGKEVKAAPASVKRDFGAELKEFKVEVAELEKTLAAQKERLDSLLRSEKSWDFATWHERYVEHPLMQLLARRIVWTFEAKDGTKVRALPTPYGFVEALGKEIEVPRNAQVALWHPLFACQEEVLAWRRYFEDNALKQPFKQAHREIYLLTDAERTTATYSNRFAAHIIKQHQFNSLCVGRGWKNSLRLMVDDSYPPATKEWPLQGLRAEFWVEGVGDDYGIDTNETGTYLRLATDQVRFYRLDSAQNRAHAGGGGYYMNYRDAPETPVPLEEVPPLVFSETMRDVDLFVGVASVGGDPTWQDGGPNGRYVNYWRDYSFGELGETAKSRADVLTRLLPRLKIRDVAKIDGRFLRVRGKLREYKIHLGSGNILMEPNDQYLCIVPGRDPGEEVLLPFEGDRTLAVVLSKAFLLAQDDKIKDTTITRQITPS